MLENILEICGIETEAAPRPLRHAGEAPTGEEGDAGEAGIAHVEDLGITAELLVTQGGGGGEGSACCRDLAT